MKPEDIIKLLNKTNRNKWVVTYMEDWRTHIDIDESCNKLKELIKNENIRTKKKNR